jgi:hypothetical protein
MFKSIDGADRAFGLESRKRVHFLPEVDRVAELAFGDAAEPLMFFSEDEGAAFFLEGFAIALEHGGADILALERETSGLDGEMGADGEAHQIDGEGHGPGFVEIVDTPDEAAFEVAPGAEIFYVKVADGEDARGIGKFGANLRPDLRPAVVGGAEEHEDVRLHVGVLEAKVSWVDTSALSQPGFELPGGFYYVHEGNDSGGGMGSQTAKGLSPQSHRGTEKT